MFIRLLRTDVYLMICDVAPGAPQSQRHRRKNRSSSKPMEPVHRCAVNDTRTRAIAAARIRVIYGGAISENESSRCARGRPNRAAGGRARCPRKIGADRMRGSATVFRRRELEIELPTGSGLSSRANQHARRGRPR